MGLFHRWRLRVERALAGARRDADLDAEVRFHLAEEARLLAARGAAPGEARLAARRAFGSTALAKEETRGVWAWRLTEQSLHDLRLGARRLAKDARVSVAAVLALALGIGAATVAFSLLDNLLLAPFPYQHADRLVTISIHNLTADGSSVGRAFFTFAEVRAFQEQTGTFEDFVASTGQRRVKFRNGARLRVLANSTRVSANAFAFYGVPALVGRGIGPADSAPGADPVFVMDYRTWQSELAGDRAAIGRIFVIDDVARTLVGVMPPRFRPGNAAIWMPESLDAGGSVSVIGRVKPGVAMSAAQADLDRVAHAFTKNEPGYVLNPAQYAVRITKLADASLGGFKSALLALLAAALMLLAIACVNVVNLLLARATAREREMAICSALGASRSRLVRQLLAEGVLLATTACGLGCACAWMGLKVVAAGVPQDTIPGEAVVALNATALAGAAALAGLTALVCGLAPALHLVPENLQARVARGVKGVGAGAGGSARHYSLRAALVVLEVALSLVLLVGAGLTLRSFFALTHEDLPFEPARTLYARIVLPQRYYAKPDLKPALFANLLPRINSLAGVVDATESLMLPPDEGSWTDIAIPGKPHVERWATDMELCTEGYFRTLGIQLLKGRLLSQDDVDTHRYVAIVNRSLARTYFGTEDPIGQKIKFEVLDRPFVDGPHNTYFEVVGVTADFRTRPGRQSYMFQPTAYLPASVAGFGQPLHLLVKTAGDPHALLGAVSREIAATEPDAAIMASGSIADSLDEEFRAPAFEFITLGAFGAVGLILVAIGVFSVMGYTVSLQQYDIGVRLALGAAPIDILAMVFRRGALLVAAGVAIGTLASAGLVQLIAKFLWGVPSTDPWSFAAAIAVIGLVGSIACFLPAHRAARVNPLVVLRSE